MLKISVGFVDNFINSLDLTSECKKLAIILLKTDNQCKTFYVGYLGRNRYTIDDLFDYREDILAISDLSLSEFIESCDNKVDKKLFQDTFLQPIEEDEVKIIESAIIDGRTSLEEIYTRFRKNTNENILRNLL